MLPLPRTLKRLAAPRLVFILGMTFLLSSRMTAGGPLRERLKPRLSLMSLGYAAAGFAATVFSAFSTFSALGFFSAFSPFSVFSAFAGLVDFGGGAFFFGASTITICLPS